MSEGEGNPYQGLDRDPLPPSEWQRQLKEAAIKFHKENPPLPPLEDTPSIDEIAPSRPVSPDKLAPRANATKIDDLLYQAQDEVQKDLQPKWYKKIFGRDK